MERAGNLLKSPKTLVALGVSLACVAIGSEKIAPTPACETKITRPNTYGCTIDNLGRATAYVVFEGEMPWNEHDFNSQQHEN